MWCGEVQLGTKCMHTYVHIIIYIHYSVIIFITLITGSVLTYVTCKGAIIWFTFCCKVPLIFTVCLCVCCVFLLVSVCLSVSDDECVYTWCAVGMWCARVTWMGTAMSLAISSMSMTGWMRWRGRRRMSWRWGGVAVWHLCTYVCTRVCCSYESSCSTITTVWHHLFQSVILLYGHTHYTPCDYCTWNEMTYSTCTCTCDYCMYTWNVFLSKMSEFLVDNVFKTWVTCKKCIACTYVYMYICLL